MTLKRKKPPMQPIVFDVGVIRFQANLLVHKLLEVATLHGFGLNELAIYCHEHGVPRSDQEQLAQLIGYSVSGFGDLSYAKPKTIAKADALADVLIAQKRAAG